MKRWSLTNGKTRALAGIEICKPYQSKNHIVFFHILTSWNFYIPWKLPVSESKCTIKMIIPISNLVVNQSGSNNHYSSSCTMFTLTVRFLNFFKNVFLLKKNKQLQLKTTSKFLHSLTISTRRSMIYDAFCTRHWMKFGMNHIEIYSTSEKRHEYVMNTKRKKQRGSDAVNNDLHEIVVCSKQDNKISEICSTVREQDNLCTTGVPGRKIATGFIPLLN